MSIDEVVDRLWCDEKNLAGICELCHNVKTKNESTERRRFKKGKK